MAVVGSSARFFQLAGAVIFFHLLNSILQEAVFHLPGFHHSVLLTLLQSACIAFFAFLDFSRLGGVRQTPLKTYLFLSLFSTGSVILTNEASRLLNYPTQVLFKSSKLLVVIIVRAAIIRLMGGNSLGGGKKATQTPTAVANNPKRDAFWRKQFMMEVVSGATIVAGIVAFTYATSASKMQTTKEHDDDVNFGIAAILVAMLFDALLYIGQERLCFAENKSSEAEVILFLYGLNAVNSFFINVFAANSGGDSSKKGASSSSLLSSFGYITEQPSFTFYVVAFSLCNFLGTRLLLKVIVEYSSSSSVVITSLRKVLTILASFVIYPKPMGILHIVGVSCVMIGVYIFEDTRKKGKKEETKELKEANEAVEKNNGTTTK